MASIKNHSSFSNWATRALMVRNELGEYSPGGRKHKCREYGYQNCIQHMMLNSDLSESECVDLVDRIDQPVSWCIGANNPMHRLNLYEEVEKLLA